MCPKCAQARWPGGECGVKSGHASTRDSEVFWEQVSHATSLEGICHHHTNSLSHPSYTFLPRTSLEHAASFPPSLLRRKATSDSLYVTNPEQAQLILKHLNTKRNTVPVLEINPGIGLLTKEILANTKTSVHCLEGQKLFKMQMESLFLENIDRMTYSEGDLMKLDIRDSLDKGDRVKKFLNQEKRNWEDGESMSHWQIFNPNRPFPSRSLYENRWRNWNSGFLQTPHQLIGLSKHSLLTGTVWVPVVRHAKCSVGKFIVAPLDLLAISYSLLSIPIPAIHLQRTRRILFIST